MNSNNDLYLYKCFKFYKAFQYPLLIWGRARTECIPKNWGHEWEGWIYDRSVLGIYHPVSSLGPGQWSVNSVLSIFSMLNNVRFVCAAWGEHRRWQKPFLGYFPKFLPLFNHPNIFSFPGAPVFGPMTKKLRLYLPCSSIYFSNWSHVGANQQMRGNKSNKG